MTIQYIRKKNCEATQLDGEFIILNTDNYTVTKLNDVGGFCWSLLSEVQSAGSLVQAVCQEFELVPSTAELDMESFLSDLIQCGLVQHAG